MLQNIILHNSFRPDILPVACTTQTASGIMLILIGRTIIIHPCVWSWYLVYLNFALPGAQFFSHSICIRLNVSWQRLERKCPNLGQSFQLAHYVKKMEWIKTRTRDQAQLQNVFGLKMCEYSNKARIISHSILNLQGTQYVHLLFLNGKAWVRLVGIRIFRHQTISVYEFSLCESTNENEAFTLISMDRSAWRTEITGRFNQCFCSWRSFCLSIHCLSGCVYAALRDNPIGFSIFFDFW